MECGENNPVGKPLDVIILNLGLEGRYGTISRVGESENNIRGN